MNFEQKSHEKKNILISLRIYRDTYAHNVCLRMPLIQIFTYSESEKKRQSNKRRTTEKK